MDHAANNYGGGQQMPAIADDADVSVIAAHAARMGIDLLIPREPSMFPNSVYMIGLASGWIFERPFETYPIDVGSLLPSDRKEPLDPEEAAAEMARIVQLLAEYRDASSSGTPGEQTPSQ
jgi:hypothetical protein